MSDYSDSSARCDVCGLYDARVFDPCGAMWCRVCDLMGLGDLAVSVKADEIAEAIGRRFDETLLFGMDADTQGLREALGDALRDAMTTPLDHAALLGEVDSPATEAGDPEAWVPDYAGINHSWRELAGEPNTAEALDGADKAYVWQDTLGAHWGWLDGSGWVAWNSGIYMQGRGAVGPFKVAYRRPVGEFNPMLLVFGGGYRVGADVPIGPSNEAAAGENATTSADGLAGEVGEQTGDAVAHPSHYTSSPAKCKACGHPIECIDVTQHMGFCLGNATKYVWRCDLKHDAIEDLRKAIQCIEFEIARREALSTTEG
ncbi:hypothetical protein MURUCUTUMBU_52 [Mycobacterium phage Murucutumbu]|uniref:Uncharacterized protein n=1 Tax=Mycobacterium phage Murucutumbu TaxID=1560286 RepID=A0A0A0RME1_9CAUD|nr:hypothetical protein AVV71_gp49 [Mycobacterium phage Murucutumbu]AIW03038.1 hypothetical protein MURUCUTUMBU_52 [Mycobacterium phage Murucutumbu]